MGSLGIVNNGEHRLSEGNAQNSAVKPGTDHKAGTGQHPQAVPGASPIAAGIQALFPGEPVQKCLHRLLIPLPLTEGHEGHRDFPTQEVGNYPLQQVIIGLSHGFILSILAHVHHGNGHILPYLTCIGLWNQEQHIRGVLHVGSGAHFTVGGVIPEADMPVISELLIYLLPVILGIHRPQIGTDDKPVSPAALSRA